MKPSDDAYPKVERSDTFGSEHSPELDLEGVELLHRFDPFEVE